MEETALPAYFGEWLKCRRKELDLTQVELAQRAGCSPPALRKIEAGKRRPSKQLAGLLAKSLEIPSEDLPIFIRVARGELGVERLRFPSSFRATGHSIELKPSTSRINLPFQPTPLIGREAELAALGKLLADPYCRLLTLTGLGGIGKTRLAIEAASANQNLFPDGVAFVALSALTSPSFIVSAVADASGFKLAGSEDPKKQLLSALRDKRLLLVLDNAEHLLDEVGLFTEVLKSATFLKLLITSRERLNLQSEWVFDVQGLPVPLDGQAGQVEQYSSVALFIQRARQVQPDFYLGPQEQPWVVRICWMVGGMPLGIELAASWVYMLTCQEIAQEIERSLDFLSTSMRDMPERQRNMRVVLDYSWQMLSIEEQQVLSKLSVFRGGFQRQAAEQVAGATLSILSTLLNRTLLRRTADGWYDLHELVRQYSAARLAADLQAQTAVRKRHYYCLLALAEAAEQGLKGRNQLQWLGRLEHDHDNLRVALEWALERDGSALGGDELALQLSGALRWFWRMRGHFHEGRDWLMESLRRYPERHTRARAVALLGLSLLMNGLGDLSAARPQAEESTAIYRELGDQQGLAEALTVLGLTLVWQGEATLGHAWLEEALTIYRKVGDQWGEAMVLYRLGSSLADYSGDLTGRAMLEESAAVLEDLGEKYLLTGVLISLGIVDMGLGDYTAAHTRFERSLTVSQEISHPWGMADALTNLGCIFRIRGDFKTAQSHFEEAQRVYQEHGRSIWEADVLCALSENDIARGDRSTARIRLQAASSLLESSENKWLKALVGYFQGLLAYYEGDAERAAVLLEEMTALAREGQYKPDLARSLVALGRVRLTLGDVVLATRLFREGLDLFREVGHKLGIAIALEQLAAVSALQGNGVQAVMLFGSADALREAIGAPLPPVDRAAFDLAVAASRSQLGETAFAVAWAQASARPFQGVVEEILKNNQFAVT
jgi:predicted ATPase/transcriptional regulator with XRE-family HTH domain